MTDLITNNGMSALAMSNDCHIANIVRMVADGVDVTVELVLLTPELAELFLVSNDRNRNILHSNIHKIATAIRAGEWEFNGSPIVFDSNGKLADGQHRCWAVIRAGTPVVTLVVRGVAPAKAQDVIDVGAKRSLNSALRIRGYANAGALAAAVNHVIPMIERGLPGQSARVPSIPSAVRFVEANPSLGEESVLIADRMRSVVALPGGPGAALHFLFALIDPVDALDFFHRATKGEGLYEGDPILALRNALSPNVISKQNARHRLPLQVRMAYTIKAWNAYRAGTQINVLRWAPGGAKPEKFPDWRQTADDPDLGMNLLVGVTSSAASPSHCSLSPSL